MSRSIYMRRVIGSCSSSHQLRSLRCLHSSALRCDDGPSDARPSTPSKGDGFGLKTEYASREEAKASAWYLDDPPHLSPSTVPADGVRQPQFTTFDPDRTTSDRPTITAKAFPDTAPESLRPLYDWLTGPDAALVIETPTVRFYNTREAPWWTVGSKEEISDPDAPGLGPRWNWAVCAVVKGTGKGVVGRAERQLRLWLHKNPLGVIDGHTKFNPKVAKPKLPRVPEDTDWSIVGIPEKSLSINLFTPDGRERWDLDDLWTGRKRKSSSFGLKMIQREEAEERERQLLEDQPHWQSNFPV